MWIRGALIEREGLINFFSYKGEGLYEWGGGGLIERLRYISQDDQFFEIVFSWTVEISSVASPVICPFTTALNPKFNVVTASCIESLYRVTWYRASSLLSLIRFSACDVKKAHDRADSKFYDPSGKWERLTWNFWALLKMQFIV